LMGLSKLENLVKEYLDCPYAYRSHIFRHSNGLFPPKHQSTTPIQIKRRYAVSKSPEFMVGELERFGYVSNHSRSEYYMRPPLYSSTKNVEQLLTDMRSDVVWAEGGKIGVN